MFLSVRPEFNAHLVSADVDGTVTRIQDMSVSDVRINGGFFAFRREILDWIEPGDELVEETFGRLVPRGEIGVYRYDGFFGPMDTIKDRQRLQTLYETESAPWLVVGQDEEGVTQLDMTKRSTPRAIRGAGDLAGASATGGHMTKKLRLLRPNYAPWSRHH